MAEEDFEGREKRVTEWLSDQMKRAVALRSKDREFHGLEREFLYIKAEMLSAYRNQRMSNTRATWVVRAKRFCAAS